jgi:hypothetical protein
VINTSIKPIITSGNTNARTRRSRHATGMSVADLKRT